MKRLGKEKADKLKMTLDEKAFEKMKPNCIFLNLGRGAIVVDEALANAIKNGSIAAAGLDVLPIEPITEYQKKMRANSREIHNHIGCIPIEKTKKMIYK